MDASDPKARYLDALRRVVQLRDQQSLSHQAVLDVIADAQGQALLTFHREAEQDPREAGLRYHLTVKALNAVWATLKYPEGRVKALTTLPVKGPVDKALSAVRGVAAKMLGKGKVL